MGFIISKYREYANLELEMKKCGWSCSIVEEVETWAVLHTLMVAWNYGARKVIVEIDSMQAFK